MSQSNFNDDIDPAVSKGPELNTALDAMELAMNSGHSGASRPSYLPANGCWVKIVTSTQHEFTYYDGADDIVIFTVDPVTNIVAFSFAVFQDSPTGASLIPSGTTGQRPAGAEAWFRLNSTTAKFEGYDGTDWIEFGGSDSALSTGNLLHIQEQQISGTNAGSFTSGSYVTRVLNTELTNNISGASLLSNQITLPAGDYFTDISCPASGTDEHKAKLVNITDVSDILIGTSERALGNVTSRSFISGYFTLAGIKVVELQHRCTDTKTVDGLGRASGYGEVEIYPDVKIWKVS